MPPAPGRGADTSGLIMQTPGVGLIDPGIGRKVPESMLERARNPRGASSLPGMRREAQVPWWQRMQEGAANAIAPMFQGQQRATDAETQRMYGEQMGKLDQRLTAYPLETGWKQRPGGPNPPTFNTPTGKQWGAQGAARGMDQLSAYYQNQFPGGPISDEMKVDPAYVKQQLGYNQAYLNGQQGRQNAKTKEEKQRYTDELRRIQTEQTGQRSAGMTMPGMRRRAATGPLGPDDVRDISGVASVMGDPDLGRILGGEDDMMGRGGRKEIADRLGDRGEEFGAMSHLWNNNLFK